MTDPSPFWTPGQARPLPQPSPDLKLFALNATAGLWTVRSTRTGAAGFWETSFFMQTRQIAVLAQLSRFCRRYDMDQSESAHSPPVFSCVMLSVKACYAKPKWPVFPIDDLPYEYPV